MYKSEFEQKVAQAGQRIQINKQEGIDLYQRALNIYFNETYDSWFDYYTAKIDLCNALKDTSEIWKGRKYLEEIIKEVNGKNIEIKLNRKKMLKVKYSATHMLGKLQLTFSDKFDPGQHYISYRKAMNESYKSFKQSFQMILQYLIGNIQDDDEIDQYWSEEYLKIKSNYIELLFNEGSRFNDKRYFQMIFQQVEKAKIYNQFIYSKKGEIHVYRCYYYQSMSLRSMEKYQQSYELLLEDYKFQLANNQFGDAEKSRNQLLKICLDLNLMQQAFKYVDCSSRDKEKNQKLLLNQIKKRRQKIKQHFNQPESLLQKCTKSTYQLLFQQFDDQEQTNMGLNQYRYDLFLMIKSIKKVIDLYKFQPSVRGILYYYLAQSNYRLQKYEQAQTYIAQAIKIPVNNQIEMRDLKIQELMIKIKLNKSKGIIQKTYNDLYQEISNKIRLERDQDKVAVLHNQKEHLIKIYKEYQKAQKKSSQMTFYNFQNQRQRELLDLVKNINKRKKENSYKQKQSINSEQEMDLQKQDQCLLISRKPKKMNKLNPQEEYNQKCLQFGLPLRQLIKQNITNPNTCTSNPLTKIMNMSVQQLLAIIPLLKIDNMDLRNHQVNNEVLALIEEFANHTAIKCFKINGNNQPSNKIILSILKKMSSLFYLSFVNFSSYKHRTMQNRLQQQMQPKSIIDMLALIREIPSQMKPQNIRILKLKYCNLLDQHLEQLGFQKYNFLQEVSLSHNLLEGTQLYHIMNLNKIKKVNFSDNPLQTLSFNHWKGRLLHKDFVLDVLKLKNIDLSGNFGIELSFIFERVKKIDLTQCLNIGNLLQSLWNNFLQGKMRLNTIEQIIIKDIDMELNLQKLMNILNECSRLRIVDLRFCKFSCKVNDEFYYLQEKNITVKTSEDVNLLGNNFELLRLAQ